MDCVGEALSKFKAVFGAEAEVEVIEAAGDRVAARFGGNMCYTCGTYDYFEDFAYFLSDCAGEDWGVESYSQNPDGTYTVVFRPRRLIGKRVRHVVIRIGDEVLDRVVEDAAS